jgi:hypothetical protein
MNMMMSLLLCLSRAAQIAKQQRSIGEQTGMSFQTEHQQKRKTLQSAKKKPTRKETNTREYDAEKLLQLGNRTVVRP